MRNRGASLDGGAKMTKKKKAEPDDQAQSDRFIETARRLQVDETGGTFERVFRKILPAKQPSPKKQG